MQYTLPHQVNSQCRLANNIAESLAESAAAYTKATARKCLLEKVEVITGEEAESNVLQVRWASWHLGGIVKARSFFVHLRVQPPRGQPTFSKHVFKVHPCYSVSVLHSFS